MRNNSGENIFVPVGAMGQPGFSCDFCGYPFAQHQLFRQGKGLYCRRHLRPMSRQQLERVFSQFAAEWELTEGPTIGGRTAR